MQLDIWIIPGGLKQDKTEVYKVGYGRQVEIIARKTAIVGDGGKGKNARATFEERHGRRLSRK